MRYTLRQLEVFLAVARHESVSRAGDEPAMSQSAVSGALADLERQFDVQLFDRVGKRLRLNGLGRSVRARAEALAAQAKELESLFESKSEVGELRVGATLTIGSHVAVPLLARFLAEHPDAKVGLDVANTAEIARKVSNFEIDLGLVEGELVEPELEVLPWCDDELVVFGPPGHPSTKRRTLDDEALREATWIVREPGSGTRQAFDRAMHGLLPELRIGIELQHTEAIKAAVKAGLGLGCLSKLALVDELRRKELVALRVPGRDFGRRFYFVLHERKHRGPALERFLAICRRHPPS